MRKKALLAVVMVLILPSLLFQGCASTYKPLAFKDSESLKEPIRVARYVDQEYAVLHVGGLATGAILTGFTIVGGLATSIAVKAWEKGVEKDIASAGVPKINELVMKKFVERVEKEIPGWPPMILEEQAVKKQKDYFRQYSSTKMLFFNTTKYPPYLDTSKGLWCVFYGILANAEGDIIWEKKFEYTSKKFGRKKSVKEYRADNFKLFKEEIEFAADTIVSDFIGDIKKGFKAPEGAAGSEGEQRNLTPEKSSQEQTQQKEEPKDSGIVSITTDPPGAKVFIDGEYKGQTPAEISLNTGTYQIFLQRQLYEPYKDSVMIEKGQTKTLNIKLSTEGGKQK